MLQASPRAPPPRAPGGPGDRALWVSGLPLHQGSRLCVCQLPPRAGGVMWVLLPAQPRGVLPQERGLLWDLAARGPSGPGGGRLLLPGPRAALTLLEGVPGRLGSLSGLQAQGRAWAPSAGHPWARRLHQQAWSGDLAGL